jgi:transcriptional regulator with XRE-family HTH domain
MKGGNDLGLIGRRVGVVRRERDLSQEKLAEKAGVTVSYVSRIEIGSRVPTLQVLLMIAVALDVPMWQLVTDPRALPSTAGRYQAEEITRLCAQLATEDVDMLTGVARRLVRAARVEQRKKRVKSGR